MDGTILSVSRSAKHTFSKQQLEQITVIAGLGVEGDAHAGETVRHRYLVRRNPNAPNLAQVHLLQAELFDQLKLKGIAIGPGELGENVTTVGLDLLNFPLRTRLHLGGSAVVELTGLRTPCSQMNGLRPGLMQACLGKDAGGAVVRKAGVMAIALAGGVVKENDSIRVELPEKPWTKLGPV